MKVLVIGGGVAGAASAIALRRIGAQVTIYEAYDDPAGQIGSFLSLAGNGLRALHTLGCLEQVQDAGVDVPRQRMWSSSGRLLADVARGRLSTDPRHSVTLLRTDLVSLLRTAAIRAGASIHTGQRLVNAEHGPDGVRATFDTRHAVEADLLVGADGIWSATRAILDPAAPRPVYGGLFDMSGVAAGIEVTPGTFNMVFARNGAFLYLPAPDGSVWWSAQVASPAAPDLTTVDLGLLTELFRHETVPTAVLRATTAVHRPTLHHVLGEVAVWHNDRIVLVGDACHPVGAGQGASMAIEDAVALAQHLSSTPSTTGPTGTSVALAGYQASRQARVARLLKAARDNREAKTAGPVGRQLNALLMRLFVPLVYERATRWLYTYDLGPLPRQQL